MRTKISLGRKKIFSTILMLLAFFVAQGQTINEFALSAYGAGNQYARDVAVDAAGNQYIAGSFDGTSTFDGWAGTPTYASAGLLDGYVAKYDLFYNLVWIVLIPGTGNDDINSVAVYPDGSSGVNVYVTGSFTGNTTIGGVSLNAPSGNSTDVTGFIAKINNSGTVVWRNVFGDPTSTGADAGLEVTANTNGSTLNVYVTGNYRGNATFYGSAGNIGISGSTTNDNGYIACYTDLGASGACNWVNTIAATGDDAGLGVDADANGNVYVTGIYRGGSATVSSTSGPGATLLISGVDDIFTLRYNNTGGLGWAIKFGGSSTTAGSDAGQSIAVDLNGFVYVACQYRNSATFGTVTLTNAGSWDVALVKLNNSPSTVSVNWAVRGGSNGADRAYDLAVDNCGKRCYLVGDYRGNATFAPMTLASFNPSNPNQDAFLAEYNTTTGQVEGVFRTGGASDPDAMTGVDVNATDDVIMCGRYSSTDCFPYFSTNSGAAGTYESFHMQWDHSNWPASSTGSASNTGVGVHNCDIYASGTLLGSATFGTTPLTSVGGSSDAYITRINKFADYNQVLPVTDGTADETTTDQASDLYGAQIITGYSSSGAGTHFYNYTGNSSSSPDETGFICKVNGSSCNVMWAVYADATSSPGVTPQVRVNGVTTDALGNIFVCGEFTGRLRFITPDQGLVFPSIAASNPVRNFFFARFTASGHYMWCNTGGNSNTDKTAYGIAVSSSGHVYVTGKFTGTSTFDYFNSTYTIPAAFGSDLFVAHYTYTTSLTTLVNVLGHNAGGFEVGNDVTALSSNEVYVTGAGSGPSLLIRCDMSWVTPVYTWVRNSSSGSATGYEVEYLNGYVFMAGECAGTAAFGSFLGGFGPGMIVKYDAATGTEICVQSHPATALDLSPLTGTDANDFGDNLITSGGAIPGVGWGGAYMGRVNFQECTLAFRIGSETADETETTGDVIIYPNPSSGQFVMKRSSNTSCTLQIVDLSGRLVFEQQNITETETPVDCGLLPQGLYLYRIISGQHVESGKIIIKE